MIIRMNIVLMEKLYQLKDFLHKHPEVLLLKVNEEKLNTDQEVIILSQKVKDFEQRYNDFLKIYDSESKGAKEVQKELFHAKEKLDNHPLVLEYMKSFKKVRILYNKINSVIFDPFAAKECQIKC